jgi:hypothetical protein
MKMKKNFMLCFIVGMMAFMSTDSFAENNDDDPIANPIPHLTPANLLATVSYNETSEQLTVTFRRSVDEAYLYIYKDDVLIDMDWLVGTTAGTTYTYYIEGSGTYTVVLQIGDSTITLYEETIE